MSQCPIVCRNMETVKLFWHLLTAVCLCNAAYIIDDKSSILSPHEIDGVVHELRLPSTKISAKQPFPLNSLDNCNRNAEKGPLNSLSGGLLSSLLSVLAKSHNLHTTEDAGSYKDNCRDNKQINPGEKVSGGDIGNDLSRNDEKTESVGPLINADIDVLSRDYEENYPNKQTTESDGSLIDADVNVLSRDYEENYPIEQTTESSGSIVDADVDVLNEDGEENKSNEQTTESSGSIVDADVDVLSRVSEENSSNEPKTEDIGSLVNADVDVLSKCHGENNPDGYSTENGISSTDDDNYYSIETGSSTVDDLNRDDEENISNGPSNKDSGSLVNANSLGKCHVEINPDGYSTESGISSTDDDDYSSRDENKANDYEISSSRSSKINDVDDLSKVNEENNSNEQTTENGGSLVDADVDVLTSEEPPLTDTIGGILKRDISNADDITNLKKIDSNNEYMQEQLDIDKGNPAMVDNSRKYLQNYHNVERENPPFNYFNEYSEYQPSHNIGNDNYYAKELTSGRFKTKMSDREFQHLPVISKSDENQDNNVNIPSEKADTSKRRFIAYDNQHDTGRGEHFTKSQEKYRRTLPITFRHYVLPERPATKMIPFDWNIQHGYLQYLEPEDNIFPQSPVASTRMFPLRIITQAGYPLRAELPHSSASSNLYGSYASAGMIPTNSYGCTGEGVIGGSETSQTGSETSVESSETTVDSSETSV